MVRNCSIFFLVLLQPLPTWANTKTLFVKVAQQRFRGIAHRAEKQREDRRARPPTWRHGRFPEARRPSETDQTRPAEADLRQWPFSGSSLGDAGPARVLTHQLSDRHMKYHVRA